MTQRGPWSVKGIDNRAREVAREAAREEGMTLGAYLNKLILEEGVEEPTHYERPAEPRARATNTMRQAPEPAQPRSGTHAVTTALERLTRRIESAEARSTLAITGIDQSVVGLLSRLENAEHGQQAMGNHLEGAMDDVRKTYEKVSQAVQRIEADESSTNNLQAIKALEDALGKLASHVYEENELVGEETNAIKMRLESGLGELTERMDDINAVTETTIKQAGEKFDSTIQDAELRAEGAVRHLSERLSGLEVDTAEKLSHVDQMAESMNTVHADVNGSLAQIQTRLADAETTTNEALAVLETRFSSLDTRLEDVQSNTQAESAANQEMRQMFEERFESLANDLRLLLSTTRAELAEEIESAAKSVDQDVLERLEGTIGAMGNRLDASDDLHAQTMDMVGDTVARVTDSVDQRLTANAEQQARAIDQVGEQVTRMSDALDQRVENLVLNGDAGVVREDMLRFTDAIDERLENLESRESVVVDKVSAEIGGLADKLTERVNDSEQRSATAIEQVGEQVAGVANRIEQRQSQALQAFSDKLTATQKRQDARLSHALDNVSDRLEKIQEQSIAGFSPVQKAITSLAQRIEAIEDFASPPYAERNELPDLPAFAAPERIETEIQDPPAGKTDVAAAATQEMPQEPDTAGFEDLSDPVVDEEPAANNGAIDAPTDNDANDDEMVFGYESWAEDANAVLDDTLTPPPATEASPEYHADVPEADEPDPDLWNDGREETRDNDIFGDDPTSPFDATTDKLEEFETSAASSDAPSPVPDTEDYLSRARRAAQSAAVENTAGKPDRKAKSGIGGTSSRLPGVAALTVVALAGTAGAALYLRGQGDTSVLSFEAEPSTPAITSATVLPDAAPALIAPVFGTEPISDTPAPVGDDDTAELLGEPEQAVSPAIETSTPEAAPVEPASTTPEAEPETAETAFTAPTIPGRPTLAEAASSGNQVAQYQQGKVLLNNNNLKDGADMIRRAANQGLAVAQRELAILHEEGVGATRDASEARTWLERSARGGNVSAMYDFATYSANGEGGPGNDQVAAEWFRKAAETGHVNSQYNLAVFFTTGRGVSPSQSEALFWFELAAKGGDADAAQAAGDIVATGGVSQEAAAQVSQRARAWNPARAAARPNGVFRPQSWEGVSAEQIQKTQQALTALGYSPGDADGAMGEQTRTAIRAFEADAGLRVTGELSDDVVRALNGAVAERRSS